MKLGDICQVLVVVVVVVADVGRERVAQLSAANRLLSKWQLPHFTCQQSRRT